MKKYTIGLFNESFPPIMDGVSLTVRNYAHRLNRTIGDAYMITPSYPGYSDREEFPVLRYASLPIPMRKPYRMGFPWLDPHLHHQLQSVPFDLLHCHSPFSAGRYALRMARLRNIPIIATFHSKYREDFLRAVHHPAIVKWMIRRIVEFYAAVDEVWIPQPAVEQTLREYGYKGNVTIVNNGTDFNDQQDMSVIRQNARKMFGIDERQPVFLFVGQMILEKNLTLILETLGALRDMDFTAYFVGEGYAAAQLKLLAERQGIADKVRFTGTIYRRDLLKMYYAAADLFLFPSPYDNAPLVVREAAAMHTPSLLLEGSTAAEIICDGVNGFLTKNDKDSMTAKIREITANRHLLQEAGRHAAKNIAHSWEDIIDTVIYRYKRLIQRKNHELYRNRHIPLPERIWRDTEMDERLACSLTVL
ncbi:MAG: glycosyltransferase [Bacteroidales bacterium]|jgi:glycosyltransferase involved in cell wall biosynthesis|nr:glycosyltransferase [Bacteroidales bacterium]